MKYLALLLLLLVAGCVKEPIGYYYDGGVVEITADTAQVVFNVPDPGGDGWNWGDSGEVVKAIDLTLNERGDKDVAITSVYWTFYNISDDYVSGGAIDYNPPFQVPKGSETALALSVTVTEGIADNLDDHEGAQDDYAGTGTIRITCTGYDKERGNTIYNIPLYLGIRVAR